MSDQDQPAPPADGADVPRLVDSYKSHREALHSRVQELVNLREAIRAAAVQEAHVIVDNARRDVRGILVKARRDLLVLSAQVQAATDDRPKALESAAPSQRERVLAEAARAGLALEREDFGAAQEVLGDARQGLHQILESARPDLSALDAEMGLLRTAAGHAAPAADGTAEARLADVLIPDFRPDPPDPNTLDLSLSTPTGRGPWFAALPRAAAFVAAFGIVGIIAMIGTTWWRSSPSSTVGASSPLAASAPPSAAPAAATAPIPAPEPLAPVSVRMEAIRDVWLRTTIDGQADAGRLLRAGETRTVSATGDIAVRMGNAGALLVSVNGSEMEPAGREGEALTRVFSRNAPSRAAGATPGTAPAAAPAPRQATAAGLDEPPPVITIDPPARAAVPTPMPQPVAPAAGRGAAAGPAGADARTDAAEGELVPAAQRWFALYHQGEHLSAGNDSPNVTDDRGQGERPQPGTAVMQRVFDEVRVQLVGDNALYTARMTERVQTANTSSQYVSLVSQVWMRRAGMWRLMDVRLVSAGRLAGNTQ